MLVRRGVQEQLGPSSSRLGDDVRVVLPFAILGDVAGLEVAHPLALAVLGGVVTSTLVNIVSCCRRFTCGSAGAGTSRRLDLEMGPASDRRALHVERREREERLWPLQRTDGRGAPRVPRPSCGSALAAELRTSRQSAPATVEATLDAKIKKVTLTPKAAERLGIEIDEVRVACDRAAGSSHMHLFSTT